MSCFLLFGFSTNLPVLFLFAVTWGMTSLGFPSLWTRIISTVALDDPLLPPVLYGIYFAQRGIANVVSGPISNRLLGSSGLGHARFAYGVGNYVRIEPCTGTKIRLTLDVQGALIVFVGAVHFAGCLTGIAYRRPKTAA